MVTGPAYYLYQRLAIYIVISKPKRIFDAAGVDHFIISPLVSEGGLTTYTHKAQRLMDKIIILLW
jgi:hypothetical protein